jgi:hypothetical protein
MADRRLYAILRRYFSTNSQLRFKERKKNQKRKNGGGPVESAANEKIDQGRLRRHFLMIFSIAWKTLLGLPQLPPALRITLNKTEIQNNRRDHLHKILDATGGGPVESAANEKIDQGRLRRHFLAAALQAPMAVPHLRMIVVHLEMATV